MNKYLSKQTQKYKQKGLAGEFYSLIGIPSYQNCRNVDLTKLSFSKYFQV